MSALLSLRSISKTYPGGITALSDINLEVFEREFLVVIGLSGSGKSTLLRTINGLTPPTTGEILFQGRRIDDLKGVELRQVRRSIGMIFQNFNLIARHDVYTNVLHGRLGYTSTLRSLLKRFTILDRKIVMQNLNIVGLSQKSCIRVDQLSGGQQQRVAIARALSQQPALLLADEPVASLDPATAHTILDTLRTANRELGVTIICNLHFLSLAREYATRVVALRDGKIVFTGLPQDISPSWFKQIYGQDAREIHVS